MLSSEAALPRLKQLEERQVETAVELMAWSPKMDILALAMKSGDLQLCRAAGNWQKIWSAAPPSVEGDEGAAAAPAPVVTSVAWRADGVVLAVGYSGGHLCLFEIDKSEPIHFNQKEKEETAVTFLAWNNCRSSESDRAATAREERLARLIGKTDPWAFITKFPPLSKAYSSNMQAVEGGEEVQRLHREGITPPSLLVAGHANGVVKLFMNGFLLCAVINLTAESSIENVQVAANISTFSILSVRPDKPELKLSVMDMSVVSACFPELQVLSSMYSRLTATLDYLDETLKQINEAWEGIVVELDRKLASYADTMEPHRSSVGSELLDLLICGQPTAQLEQFLLQELTEKGLKKLQDSTDNSYLNIQRLVLKYLHAVSQSINFILFELEGMVMASSDKYSIIGVRLETIRAAQGRAAKFWCKGYELQQVVDESRKSFRSFFRWLHSALLKLEEPGGTVDEMKVSQQEIKFIAEFLDNFDLDEDIEYNEEGIDVRAANNASDASDVDIVTHKHLEKVGQYLRLGDLEQPVDRSDNFWHKFLRENPHVAEIEGVIAPSDKTSLALEKELLKDAVTAIFDEMTTERTGYCGLLGEVVVPFERGAGKPTCRQHVCGGEGGGEGAGEGEGDNRILGAITQATQVHDHGQTDSLGTRVFYYELRPPSDLKGLWLTTDGSGSPPGSIRNQLSMKSIDLAFYGGDTLSLLLGHVPVGDSQRLLQLPLDKMASSLVALPMFGDYTASLNYGLPNYGLQSRDVFDGALSDLSCHRELENIAAASAAISGPRKVAALLFRNRRRIRIYDMEVEDDDDDEDDTLGTSGAGNISTDLNSSM